ncbi:beta-hydroxyacyl-ACP dehydratase [uncultured Alistipes sp.]|jgi:hypothetical protein|uniref:beta-hydroxyacyl-ACP dehydratase n=1 Tax=uncultured Alistipes sp. TaxID=538949 RepID=UPI0025D7CE65|nr:beta-hydroxyacyl-ACP dehydratase [uncultured Alistipes sp.]
MLEGLYTCIARNGDKTRLEADISLNAAHPLFEGHFPGKPVLPGVCQLHIVKELIELHTGRSVNCRSVRELKFLSPIVPPHDILLRINFILNMTDNGIILQGTISTGDVQKTKIKATFV